MAVAEWVPLLGLQAAGFLDLNLSGRVGAKAEASFAGVPILKMVAEVALCANPREFDRNRTRCRSNL